MVTKKIEITENQCESVVYCLEEFIISQTLDAVGNLLTTDECQMLDDEIDRLRNLVVGESMALGEPEAGLTAKRVG
jgi:hypothetical protein